jgi:serine protease AprX
MTMVMEHTPLEHPGNSMNHSQTFFSGSGTRKIGVAPDSKWIGCRVMEGGFARDKTIISCLQFFLAPHDEQGKNPNPKLRPVSIGNSYGCNPTRCPDSEVQKQAVEALYASGVLMVVSAGNSGPRCSTIDRPPTHYEKSFVVGATNYNSTAIASFSSRGPVKVDRSDRLKPDVTAPGVNVVSCYPPSSYRALSGTSMASPAVNGAIALLYQAVPEVARNLKCVTKILEKTAVHQKDKACGSPQESPNYTFGYGTIDIFKAVEYARKHKCD